MRDDEIGRALERLAVPPEDPAFFTELRGRLRELDRASARRWRRAAVALAAVAAAAVAAVVAVATARGGGAVLDRTLTCTVAGPVPGVSLEAWPQTPGGGPAGLRLGDAGARLLGFASSVTGFVLDGARCRGTATAVPLQQDTLPTVVAYSSGYERYVARCFPAGRLLLRIRLALGGDGRPRRAVVALRAASDGRPLALVRWQPGLVQASAGRDCPSS